MDEIFKIIGAKESDYFLTGSVALGLQDETSDHDYVLRIEHRHHLINYLGELGIEIQSSCYNGGFKFLLDGKYYNIITCIDIEFMAWREALSIIQLLMKTDNIYRDKMSGKMRRYCLYESLRALIKTTIIS